MIFHPSNKRHTESCEKNQRSSSIFSSVSWLGNFTIRFNGLDSDSESLDTRNPNEPKISDNHVMTIRQHVPDMLSSSQYARIRLMFQADASNACLPWQGEIPMWPLHVRSMMLRKKRNTHRTRGPAVGPAGEVSGTCMVSTEPIPGRSPGSITQFQKRAWRSTSASSHRRATREKPSHAAPHPFHTRTATGCNEIR